MIAGLTAGTIDMKYTVEFSAEDYDEICRVLTDYENESEPQSEHAVYTALVHVVRAMAESIN